MCKTIRSYLGEYVFVKICSQNICNYIFALLMHWVALSTQEDPPPPATLLTTQEKIKTWLLVHVLAIGRLAIPVKMAPKKKAFSIN